MAWAREAEVAEPRLCHYTRAWVIEPELDLKKKKLFILEHELSNLLK